MPGTITSVYLSEDSEYAVYLADEQGVVLIIYLDGQYQWGEDGHQRLREMDTPEARTVQLLLDTAFGDRLNTEMGTSDPTKIKFTMYNDAAGMLVFMVTKDDAVSRLSKMIEDEMLDTEQKEEQATYLVKYLRSTLSEE